MCVCVCVCTGFACLNAYVPINLIQLYQSLWVSHSYAAYFVLSPFIWKTYKRAHTYTLTVHTRAHMGCLSLLNLVTSMSLYLSHQTSLKITGGAWKKHFSVAKCCPPLPSTLCPLMFSSWRRNLIVWKVYSIIMECVCACVRCLLHLFFVMTLLTEGKNKKLVLIFFFICLPDIWVRGWTQ